MSELYIGTSGYTYKDWRGIFYPKGVAQKKWLSFYAEHYNTVKINATFYRPLPRSVLEHWSESTPSDFRFTIKGSRRITHQKKLHEIEDDLKQFVEGTEGLKDKLSVMLWQFPANAHADGMLERLQQFLSLLPTETRQVFEFRHRSWFNDDVYKLLDEHHAGFVINHSRRFPAEEKVTGDFAYVRFHGPGKHASLYSKKQLKQWAEKIKSWLKHGDVYVYFNNDYHGHALRNADELKELLKG